MTGATDTKHIKWYAPVALTWCVCMHACMHANCKKWSTNIIVNARDFFSFILLLLLISAVTLLLLLLLLTLPVMIVFSFYSLLDITSFPKSFVTSHKFRHEQSWIIKKKLSNACVAYIVCSFIRLFVCSFVCSFKCTSIYKLGSTNRKIKFAKPYWMLLAISNQ